MQVSVFIDPVLSTATREQLLTSLRALGGTAVDSPTCATHAVTSFSLFKSHLNAPGFACALVHFRWLNDSAAAKRWLHIGNYLCYANFHRMLHDAGWSVHTNESGAMYTHGSGILWTYLDDVQHDGVFTSSPENAHRHTVFAAINSAILIQRVARGSRGRLKAALLRAINKHLAMGTMVRTLEDVYLTSDATRATLVIQKALRRGIKRKADDGAGERRQLQRVA
mgnify:CR=1 FL=1